MPSVLQSFVPWLAWTAVAAVLLGGYARWLASRDDADAVARLGRVVQLGLPAAGAVAYGSLWVADAGAAVRRAVAAATGLAADGAAAYAVSTSVVVGACLLSVLAAYVPAVPTIRRLRDLDLPTVRAAARMGRYLAVFWVAFVPLVTVLTAPSLDESAALALVPLAAVLFYVASPLVYRLGTATRPPTDAERERLAATCDRLDFHPRAVRVVEFDAEEQPTASVRGPPGRRHLFVSDYLLAADETRLHALVAVEAARARLWHLDARFACLLGIATVALADIAGVLDPLAATVGLSGSVLALGGTVALAGALWRLRRWVFRADADAADRVGARAVLEAFEWLADHGVSREQGRLLTLARSTPPLAARMDRLRDRLDGDRDRRGERTDPSPAER